MGNPAAERSDDDNSMRLKSLFVKRMGQLMEENQ